VQEIVVAGGGFAGLWASLAAVRELECAGATGRVTSFPSVPVARALLHHSFGEVKGNNGACGHAIGGTGQEHVHWWQLGQLPSGLMRAASRLGLLNRDQNGGLITSG
jgi:hypothetical protein